MLFGEFRNDSPNGLFDALLRGGSHNIVGQSRGLLRHHRPHLIFHHLIDCPDMFVNHIGLLFPDGAVGLFTDPAVHFFRGQGSGGVGCGLPNERLALPDFFFQELRQLPQQ